MENTDKLLLASLDDKQRQCEEQYIQVTTGFLDSHQVAVAMRYLRVSPTRHVFFGGYDDAERRICAFLPDYAEEADLYDDEESPLRVLRVTSKEGGRSLTHRDYLGSVLALGLDRSVIGDIVVCGGSADIVILREMGEFLLANYDKAGRTSLSAEVLPIGSLRTGEVKIEEVRDTVASLRLDNLVASAFNLSRGKAQEAVQKGMVFLNSIECVKPDVTLEEGDKIVLRRAGKVILKSVSGRSKKDRICIVLSKYK